MICIHTISNHSRAALRFQGRNYARSEAWHLVLDSSSVMIGSLSRKLELADDLLLLVLFVEASSTGMTRDHRSECRAAAPSSRSDVSAKVALDLIEVHGSHPPYSSSSFVNYLAKCLFIIYWGLSPPNQTDFGPAHMDPLVPNGILRSRHAECTYDLARHGGGGVGGGDIFGF